MFGNKAGPHAWRLSLCQLFMQKVYLFESLLRLHQLKYGYIAAGAATPREPRPLVDWLLRVRLRRR